jgi:hypothetical protein
MAWLFKKYKKWRPFYSYQGDNSGDNSNSDNDNDNDSDSDNNCRGKAQQCLLMAAVRPSLS